MKGLLFFALLTWTGSLFAQTQADSLDIPAPFVTNPVELLKGRNAGVQVISSAAAPGMEPAVYIRGAGATPSSRPLYLVDGVRVESLNGISPEDVESVEALRNGTALTLYGPDAADGVVLVKTRRANRSGFHASYSVQVLFQQIAWVPENITVDQYNEWRTRNGYTPLYGMTNLNVADETEPSFSHQHHLALQWSGPRLNAYAGLSYLDLDSPLRGKNGLRRYTGSWSLTWTPLSWIRVTTAGNYGKGSSPMANSSTWDHWQATVRSAMIDPSAPRKKGAGHYDHSTLSGSAEMEVHPVAGLFFRAEGGYSRDGLNAAQLGWWQEDGPVSFHGNTDERIKWHWKAEAGYETRIGDSHLVQVDLSFQNRVEKFDLFSANGELTSSQAATAGKDVPTFLDNIIVPEMARFRESEMKEMNHLLTASPYRWYWQWRDMTVHAGYTWENGIRADGALIRSRAFDGTGEGPLNGWSLSGDLNLIHLLRQRVSLPAWCREWSLRGSLGQTDRILRTRAFSVFEYTRNGDEVMIVSDSVLPDLPRSPYQGSVVRAARREIGMDTRFQLDHSELSFSITRFSNDDDARARMSTPTGLSFFLDYAIRNKGWELDGTWKGGRGDFHFSAGGNLTFYSNMVVSDEKEMSVVGFPWSWLNNSQLLAKNGDPVGVVRLYPFVPDSDGSLPWAVGLEPSYTGGSFPTVAAGIHGMIGWKQWAIILSGHGHSGNSILCDSLVNSALFKYYLDTYPKEIPVETTTASLFSGRFFRVDQVRLQYEFRSHLRLYASLDNFFLFTSYPGSDPEMALHGTGFGFETASFPTSRRILAGLEIAF